MTKSRSQKFEDFQRHVLEQLVATNQKLDKICALLVSDQLLQECIDPEGVPRDAETCAGIVTDSFSAGLCLSEDLNSHQREFAYHVSEFFIEGEEDEAEEDDEDGDEDEEDEEPRSPVSFF
jgi:hypothetical protein